MGLLKLGSPLSWEETKAHSAYIRQHGVLQFLHTLRRFRGLDGDRLLYGDELEYGIVRLDHEQKRARVSIRGSEVLEALRAKERSASPLDGALGCTWHQEYGAWMVEGTPAGPYSGYAASLLQVEQNMRLRRARLLSVLAPDEIAPSLVAFPLLGVGDFTSPPLPTGAPARSSSVPDGAVNPHPRFGTLTANIRHRRGSKVDIRVPLFRDEATLEFAGQDTKPESPETPQIEMDCMAYGMGCCCLQVTFQASNMDESRFLYDHLAALAPLMLALTAATPILRGRLAATDARWDVIAASVDDRTPAERGEAPSAADPLLAGGGVRRLSKSRYASISTYIHAASCRAAPGRAGYNDVECEVDEELQQLLLQEGVDAPLARHVSHLFTRDPLVAFSGAVQEVDDHLSVEHFESVQSTNWQTVRWKPPPPRSDAGAPHIGWRTEFRPMEVQLTDFENAAFTAFVVLLTRALLAFDLSLLIPLSKVDENMRRAHALNAVTAERFWFRADLVPDQPGVEGGPSPAAAGAAAEECDKSREMTLDEVINGDGCDFPGLVPICYAYLEHIQCDHSSLQRIRQYLTLVEQRASGRLCTAATWMRRFVREHPAYRQDSVVSQEIAYDLLRACDDIGCGRRRCPELLGDVAIEPIRSEHVYATPLCSAPLAPEARMTLLRRYMRCPGEHSGFECDFLGESARESAKPVSLCA